MDTYPQINNGKRPGEVFNANLIFWLSLGSLYGNLQLKHMDIIQRIDITTKSLIHLISGTAYVLFKDLFPFF